MTTHYYDVNFEIKGSLTSDQYRLVSQLLWTLVNELDLEFVRDEVK